MNLICIGRKVSTCVHALSWSYYHFPLLEVWLPMIHRTPEFQETETGNPCIEILSQASSSRSQMSMGIGFTPWELFTNSYLDPLKKLILQPR